MDYNSWNDWKKEHILANGVRLWYKQTPSETSIICAIVDAGSRHDGKVPGIAHFTEHMLFQGTKTLPDEQIKFVAAENGISINAATSKEFLFVETSTILPGKIDIALELCKEAIMNPIFPQESFDREKKVVLSEIGDSDDHALGKAMDSARAKICQHPFKLPVLGTKKSISDATVKDMIAFHGANFTPAKTTICYAGSMDMNELVKLCEAKFGDWKTKEIKWDYEISEEVPHSNVINRPDLNQVGVVVAYPGVPFESDDSVKLKALCNIIGGGMVSRMFRELRNKKGLCYFCGATLQTFYGSNGVLCFYGSTATSNVEAFVNGIKEILGDITSVDPIQQRELDITKTVIKSNMLSMVDSLDSYMNMFLYIWGGKDKRKLGTDLQITENLTIGDITNIVEKFITSEPEVFLVGNIPETTASSLKLMEDMGMGAPSAPAMVDRPTPAATSHAAGPNKVNPSFNPGNRKVESVDDVLKPAKKKKKRKIRRDDEEYEEDDEREEDNKKYEENDEAREEYDKAYEEDDENGNEDEGEDEDDEIDEPEDLEDEESMADVEPSCIPKESKKCSVCGEPFDHLAGVNVHKCPDCKLKDIDFQQPLKKVSIYSKDNKCLAEIELHETDIKIIES